MNTINKNKTHCINGHLFDEENTRFYGKNMTQRACRKCQKERGHQRHLLKYQPSDKPRGWHLRAENRIWKPKTGEDHYAWKGNSVSVKAGRQRARRTYQVEACAKCGKPGRDRHHKNGNTADNSQSNVEILCRRCHMLEDGRLDRFRALAQENKEKAKQKTAEKECRICKAKYPPYRKGRCPNCSEYFRRNRIERK